MNPDDDHFLLLGAAEEENFILAQQIDDTPIHHPLNDDIIPSSTHHHHSTLFTHPFQNLSSSSSSSQFINNQHQQQSSSSSYQQQQQQYNNLINDLQLNQQQFNPQQYNNQQLINHQLSQQQQQPQFNPQQQQQHYIYQEDEMFHQSFEEEQDSYDIIDDEKQQESASEFPTLAQEDVTNEQRLDEILAGAKLNEEKSRIEYYIQHGVKYPFIAQWRNPLIHSIRENVIVKSVVQFNNYFGIVMIIEPLYLSNDKKKKKMKVKDLRRTGFYCNAVDLYGMKKKSVIGRLLDDHRKYIKRLVLVNEIKSLIEENDLEFIKLKCENKIQNINEITHPIPNHIRIKSKEEEDDTLNNNNSLVTIVNRYDSHGGNPPQKINKKIDVMKAAKEIQDTNERITSLCPPSTGTLNDLPTFVRYITNACTFPFEAKVTSRYSYLNEQQVEFTILVNSVNYRCKQGIIFKASILSGKLEPIERKFRVSGGPSSSDNGFDEDNDSDDDDDDENTTFRRKKRKMNDHRSFDTYNGQTIKVEACRIILEDTSSVNYRVLSDYQTWFSQSILLDERRLDDQWNSLRFYLQFIE